MHATDASFSKYDFFSRLSRRARLLRSIFMRFCVIYGIVRLIGYIFGKNALFYGFSKRSTSRNEVDSANDKLKDAMKQIHELKLKVAQLSQQQLSLYPISSNKNINNEMIELNNKYDHYVYIDGLFMYLLNHKITVYDVNELKIFLKIEEYDSDAVENDIMNTDCASSNIYSIKLNASDRLWELLKTYVSHPKRMQINNILNELNDMRFDRMSVQLHMMQWNHNQIVIVLSCFLKENINPFMPDFDQDILKRVCNENYDVLPHQSLFDLFASIIDHLLCIISFLEHQELASEMRKCCRKLHSAETKTTIKRRHCECAHWFRLLCESIMLFGKKAPSKQVFYHGLQRKLEFKQLEISFSMPIAMTYTQQYARNYCGHNGILVKFETIKECYYFDTQKISSHPQEKEVIFFYTDLFQVKQVWEMNYDKKIKKHRESRHKINKKPYSNETKAIDKDHIQTKQKFLTKKENDDEQINKTKDTIDLKDVVSYCRRSWDLIEFNEEKHRAVRNVYECTIKQIKETNVWLFNRLQETLNKRIRDDADRLKKYRNSNNNIIWISRRSCLEAEDILGTDECGFKDRMDVDIYYSLVEEYHSLHAQLCDDAHDFDIFLTSKGINKNEYEFDIYDIFDNFDNFYCFGDVHHRMIINEMIPNDEDKEAIELALKSYRRYSAPWQKESFIKRKKLHIIKREQMKINTKPKAFRLFGLQLIAQKLEQCHNDFDTLKKKEKLLHRKMIDLNDDSVKEELNEYRNNLKLMLLEQEHITESLKQTMQIIMNFLDEDGRQGLINFIKIKLKGSL